MDDKRLAQFCRVCESLDILPFDEHIMTKPHQITVHQKEFTVYRATHGIYVNNLPNAVAKEEIVSFFAQYGTIISFMICDNNVYGIFEYEDQQVVTDLIARKNVDFNGRSIMIRARNPRPEKKYINDEAPKVNPNEAIQLLRSQTDVISEISALHRYLQPVSRERYYAALCMDLKTVLAQYMNCMVYPFGSTVTGLDFVTSDVDAYIYVDPQSLPNRIGGKITGDVLAKRLVEIIPPYLTTSYLFVKVVSIPNANTPIIKCVHLRTGIACDINFKNMLGVCNSYLIKHYLGYNRRLNIASVIIKYWAKVHSLTGVGKFSNYSMTMLFLFCLMQPPYNLPAVHNLQQQKQRHVSNEQDGWDAGFEFGDYAMSDALNRLGVAELILEFFKFYANFNYADLVICPYVGRALERSAFTAEGVLPQEYDRYSKRLATNGLYPTTPICVQDCFELCRNITRAVRLQEFEEFVELCKEGVAALSGQSIRLFPIFFDSCCTDEDTFQFVLIETNKLRTYLARLHKSPNSSLDDRHFQDFVKDFVTRALVHVFLFDLQIESKPSNQLSSSPPMKLQRKDNYVGDSDDFNVTFVCRSHVDVWTSRGIIAKDQPKVKDENVFDMEVRLSEYIATTLCKKIKTKVPILKLKVALMEGDQCNKDIKVTVTNEGVNVYAFKDFSALFVKFVKNLFIRYITSLIDKNLPTAEDVETTQQL